MGEATRAILHVDMDAFYASVEQRDRPELRGKPVVVGGTPEGRGVVSAASYEARAFGVHSAMGAGRARRLCPDAIFLRPRMARYVEASKAVFAILEGFTPDIEPLSIDEAFLDVTHCRRLHGDPVGMARRIKARIRDEVGLAASVGVAPNKFLAKLASDLEKPDGLVVIRAEEARARLARLPVGVLWGVGRVMQRSLNDAGVHLVKHLLEVPEEALLAAVGDAAHRLRLLAQGIDDRPVRRGGGPKSIGAETTFGRDIGDPARLREVLDGLVEKIAARLRKKGLEARTVRLKARFPDFKTLHRARTLDAPTDATAVLRDVARELLESRLDRRGRPLRLLGVAVAGFQEAGATPGGEQLRLFEEVAEAPDAAAREVDRVVDRIRAGFGDHALVRGNLLEASRRRQERERERAERDPDPTPG